MRNRVKEELEGVHVVGCGASCGGAEEVSSWARVAGLRTDL